VEAQDADIQQVARLYRLVQEGCTRINADSYSNCKVVVGLDSDRIGLYKPSILRYDNSSILLFWCIAFGDRKYILSNCLDHLRRSGNC